MRVFVTRILPGDESDDEDGSDSGSGEWVEASGDEAAAEGDGGSGDGATASGSRSGTSGTSASSSSVSSYSENSSGWETEASGEEEDEDEGPDDGTDAAWERACALQEARPPRRCAIGPNHRVLTHSRPPLLFGPSCFPTAGRPGAAAPLLHRARRARRHQRSQQCATRWRGWIAVCIVWALHPIELTPAPPPPPSPSQSPTRSSAKSWRG